MDKTAETQDKLGDFGISKILEESECAISQKGTKLYMAPEMFRGEKYDATVDIYSLGLVLYRLFNNNRAPFMPEYPQTIRMQDKEEALQRRLTGEMLPDPCNADSDTAAVIKKACGFHPKTRYQTPGEMRKALEGLVNNPEEICMLDNDIEGEDSSKTLFVQSMMGSYSLEKHPNAPEQKKIIKIAGLLSGLLILAIGMWLCQRMIAQNTEEELCFHTSELFGQTMEKSTSEIVGAGISAAEHELERYWIIVPKLSDMKESEALRVLLEAGYLENEVVINYEYCDDVQEGLIMDQSIEPSVRVRKGTGISIIVSRGSKPVSIRKQKSEDNESNILWRELE